MADELQNQIDQRRQQLLGDEVQAKIDARRAELEKFENAGVGFGMAAGRNILDSVLALPKLPALGAAAVQAPFSEQSFSEIFAEEKEKFPANLAIDTNELFAGIRSLPELLPQRPVDQPGVENPVPLFTERVGERFDEELFGLDAEQRRLEEKFPAATDFGGISGDILSIMFGRLPFLSKIEKGEAFLAGQKFADVLRNPSAAGEIGNVAKRFADAKGVRALLRGTGRAGEAGMEALVLEALKGDDPLKAATYVAGGQALLSPILFAAREMTRTGGRFGVATKLGLFAGAHFALLQTIQSGIPGGQDSPIKAIKEAFTTTALLLGAGGIAAAMGGGRIRRSDMSQYPRIGEFISTLPRANMIRLVTDYVEATPDEQQTIDATLEQLRQDPEFFGEEISEKLLSAFENGNLVEALREEF